MATPESVVGDLADLVRDWNRSLRVAGRSPRTIETYSEATTQFGEFLAGRGHSMVTGDITRRDVEEFVLSLAARRSPATVSNRFRGVQAFFKFVVEEGELERSPMAAMTPPTVPERPVRVLAAEEVRGLLTSVEGRHFDARRDQAIVRLLYDTEMRRAELAGLRVDDVDLDLMVAVVTGKAMGRPHACASPSSGGTGPWPSRSDRRRDSFAGGSPWLGTRGRLTPSGIARMLRRKGGRRVSPCTHTSFDMPLPMSSSLTAGRKATSCGWQTGGRRR